MKTEIEHNEKRNRRNIIMDEKIEFVNIELKEVIDKINFCYIGIKNIIFRLNKLY